jgi:glycosyltransferase involved in cell wall biosynthesis
VTRILFITNGYPPSQVAGTEVSTEAVAVSLAAAGHEVAVACAGRWDDGPLPFNGQDTEVQDGVMVTRFHLNWKRGPAPNRALFDNPLTATAVGELIDRTSPHVVHVTSCYTLSASVIREVKARCLPLVVTLTDYWFLCPRVSLLRSDGTRCTGKTTPSECLNCMLSDSTAYARLREHLPAAVVDAGNSWVARRPSVSRLSGFRGRALDFAVRKPLLLELLGSADVVLAPTCSLAHRHADLGLDREIRLWPYGHDLRWAQLIERRPRAGGLVFGFVGRIAQEKGVHVLLDAASRLGEQATRAVVEVWGDPDQDPGYSAHCRAIPTTGLPVHFRGRFDRASLAEVYGGIGVLVVPSIWDENSPVVVHEAFAAGVPVVASAVAGMHEVIADGRDGFLFPAGDPHALAAALARLIEDRGLAERLRAGIQPVRTAAEAAAELVDLYSGLIAAGS